MSAAAWEFLRYANSPGHIPAQKYAKSETQQSVLNEPPGGGGWRAHSRTSGREEEAGMPFP